jgi:transcriptional regulator with XRE-family HTH domain
MDLQRRAGSGQLITDMFDSMKSWDLRKRRRESGLTLREAARAAGTSETNLSAYERGAKVPNRRTLSRILASVSAGSESPIHTRRLLTLPATASSLRKGLREGWTTADLLRLIREMRSNAKFVTSRADHEAFYAEPSTTGDKRWDAMLAGNVEELTMRDGYPAPEWTRGGSLPEFWFVGTTASLRAYAFSHSPFPLQIRGVMVDPADLESI